MDSSTKCIYTVKMEDYVEDDDRQSVLEPEEQLQEREQKRKKAKELRYKVLKQITLIGLWIAMGMFLEIIGPSLKDLKDNIGVNYEEISRCLLAKSAGNFLGAITGGPLHERFYSRTDLIMSVGIFIGAAGIALTPLMTSLPLVGLMLALTGVAEGIINTGGNTMVLHMWGEKAAAPMCSLHFGFGIGAILATHIVAPFRREVVFSKHNNIMLSNTTNISAITEIPYVLSTVNNNTVNYSTLPWYHFNTVPQLFIPFAIVGLVTAVFAVLFLIFFCIGPPKSMPVRKGTEDYRKLVHPGQCGYGSGCYGLMLLMLLFVYYIQAAGGERAYGKYIASYSQLNEVQFNIQQQTMLVSVFWFCHMSGRLTGTLVSYWVPVSITMAFFISGGTVGSIVLAIYGHDTPMVLWIFTGVMGFCISLGYPSGMSWANLHMQINSVAVMVLLMGASCGGFLYHYLPGYLFHHIGHKTLMYVMVGYGVLLCVNFVIMEWVARKIGKFIKNNYFKKNEAKEAVELEIMMNNKHGEAK